MIQTLYYVMLPESKKARLMKFANYATQLFNILQYLFIIMKLYYHAKSGPQSEWKELTKLMWIGSQKGNKDKSSTLCVQTTNQETCQGFILPF